MISVLGTECLREILNALILKNSEAGENLHPPAPLLTTPTLYSTLFPSPPFMTRRFCNVVEGGGRREVKGIERDSWVDKL